MNNMCKKLMLLAIMLMPMMVSAQENVKAEGKDEQKHYRLKYIFGMKYNDWRVAADALYNMIALDPGNDSLRMELSYLYYDNNVYPSALFITNDVLSRNPNNTRAMRLNGICYEKMGVLDKAVSSYESLYMEENNIEILYQIAALQFEIGRFDESITNAEIVAENEKSGERKLQFPVGEDQSQQVRMDAGAYFLMGMIESNRGNAEEASKHFNKALEIEPEFARAKEEMKKTE